MRMLNWCALATMACHRAQWSHPRSLKKIGEPVRLRLTDFSGDLARSTLPRAAHQDYMKSKAGEQEKYCSNFKQNKMCCFVLFSALLGAQRAFPPLPLTFVSHGDPSRCHARLVHTPHERPGALDSKPCCTAQLKTRSYGRQSASSARSQTRAISPFPGITRFGHPGSGENSWKVSKTCELLTPETAGTSIPVDQTSFGWVLNLSCVGLLATFANLILLFNQNWNPHQTARVWLLVRLKLSRLQDLVQASQKLSGEQTKPAQNEIIHNSVRGVLQVTTLSQPTNIRAQ